MSMIDDISDDMDKADDELRSQGLSEREINDRDFKKYCFGGAILMTCFILMSIPLFMCMGGLSRLEGTLGGLAFLFVLPGWIIGLGFAK